MKDPIQKYFYIGTIQWMTHPPMKYKLLDSIKTLVADEFLQRSRSRKLRTKQLEKGQKDVGAVPHEGLLWRTTQDIRPKVKP